MDVIEHSPILSAWLLIQLTFHINKFHEKECYRVTICSLDVSFSSSFNRSTSLYQPTVALLFASHEMNRKF